MKKKTRKKQKILSHLLNTELRKMAAAQMNKNSSKLVAMLLLFGLWGFIFSVAFNYYSESRTQTRQSVSASAPVGYDFRKTITINSSEVSGTTDLVDFPIYIDITADTDLANNAQDDGDDLLFTNDADVQLDYEIVSFNGTTGELQAWVKIPSLSATSDTQIYLYYGNSGVTSSGENPEAVWSAYTGVWQMEEDPSSSNLLDSTNSNFDATPISMSTANSVPGKLGNALDFDGSNDYLSHPGSLNKQTGTISSWVRADVLNQMIIYYEGDGTGSGNNGFGDGGSVLEIHTAFQSSNVLTAFQDGTNNEAIYSEAPTVSTWHQIVLTWDRSSHARLYKDGLEIGDNYIGNVSFANLTATVNYIGSTGSGARKWNGLIDHTYISNQQKTSHWIATEFNNQNTPFSFISVSAEEDIAADPFCGDGTIDAGEVCDDGNNVNGDQCSSDCLDSCTSGQIWNGTACVTPSNPYYNWQYRKPITILSSQVSGSTALTNFPILIHFSADSDIAQYAQSDGDDILFTANDGVTKLDHEIESYNTTTGELKAWVKIPSLSATSDTNIYILYGNSSASNQENAASLWSEYAGVWHMSQDPSSSQLLDSTGNNNHGTSNGGMTSSDLITGQIGSAIDFDGSNDYFNMGDASSLDVGTSNFTIQVWHRSSDSNSQSGIVAKGGVDYQTNRGYQFNKETGGTSIRLAMFGDTEFVDSNYGGFSMNNSTWKYLSLVVNRSGNADLYVNNILQGSKSISSASSQNLDTNANFYIGTSDRGVETDMDLDEVRIAKVVRSSNWISTEYNNHINPSSFINLGVQELNSSFCGDGSIQNPNDLGVAEECDDGNEINTDSCTNTCTVATCGDGIVYSASEACDDGNNTSGDGCSSTCEVEPFEDTNWSFRKLLTVESDLVPGSTSFTNIPVLIELTGDTDLQNDALSNGNDIIFTANDGTTQLDHEIESFNKATGDLYAWVRIPALSPTSDTTIYMYYGNSTAANRENPGGVWANNYIGVWHLQEDPTTSAPQMLDSTSYNHHGNSQGSMTIADSITAQILNGLDLDGVDDYIVVPHQSSGSLDVGTNDFTLQFWLRTTDSPSQNIAVLAKGAWGGSEDYSGFRIDMTPGGVLRFNIDGPGLENRIESNLGSTSVNDGVWRQVTIVFDRDNLATLYLNGVQSGTVDISSLADTSFDNVNPFYIGRNDGGRFIDADFDEVRIIAEALTSDRIVSEFNNKNSSSTFVITGVEENVINFVCGDGIVDSANGEVCDDGNTENLDSCSSTCLNECTGGQYWDGSSCVDATCGNGTLEYGEICDTGSSNGDACTATYGETCQYCDDTCDLVSVVGSFCGDGTVDSANGEVCDDGNQSNGDQCSSDCLNSCSSPDTWDGTTCITPPATCGDGSLDSGEECDFGDTNGITCTPLYGSNCTYCTSSCTNVTLQGSQCGDGIRDESEGEVCDDGNTSNGDQCADNCLNQCSTNRLWNGSSCVTFSEYYCNQGEEYVEGQCIAVAAGEAICGYMDSDQNGLMNIIDFANFAKKYNKTCIDDVNEQTLFCGSTDSDNNDFIDIIDFANFALDYAGVTCPTS